MADTSRIDGLRRRVRDDPASIAFAQLGEELRRIGQHEEAVRVCRAGLEVYPAYISARVTLGRALAELGRLDEARAEFEQVLRAAPDNLLAVRGMADLHQRHDTAPTEIELAPTRVELAPTAMEFAPTEIGLAPTEIEIAPTEIEFAPTEIGLAPVAPTSVARSELERWLSAILADRADRERRV